MSSYFGRSAILTYWPYAALWLLAAWQRSWSIWGLVQLLTLGLMLWGCADVSLRAWRRGGFWRFVGVTVGALPWVACAWLAAFHDTPMGPGGITMLVTGTTMAWAYVASSFSYDLALSMLGGLILWTGAVRILMRGSFAACLAAGALAFHAASIWLVLVAYEDLPPGLPAQAIGQQESVTHQALDGRWDTARDLVISSDETTAFGAFMSSNRGPNKHREPGIVRIDLATGLVTGQYLSRMGDTLVLDEAENSIWFSSFLDGYVQRLDTISMQVKAPSFKVEPWPDGVAKIASDQLVVRVETPRRDDFELYWIDLQENAQVGVNVDAHRWGNLNAAMEAVAERSEVFLLQTGDDRTTLSAVSPQGVRESKILPGIIWEAAWDQKEQAVWLGSMTEDSVFKVDAASFEHTAYDLPNGIREILPIAEGWVALADYLRARVYLFDGKEIRKTIQVGRKPEAMALGPLSGALYVLSDAGLTRIDLSRIQAGL